MSSDNKNADTHEGDTMKATINHQTITGFLGQVIGPNDTRWLFVNGTSSKTRRTSYPVAKVCLGEIVYIEPQQQLSGFTNEEVARALIAAANN